MKTIVNRTENGFKYMTVVYSTKKEAEANMTDRRMQVTPKVSDVVHGANGYVVANSLRAGDFVESFKVVAFNE